MKLIKVSTKIVSTEIDILLGQKAVIIDVMKLIKVSTKGLSTEIDILIRSPFQVLTEADVA